MPAERHQGTLITELGLILPSNCVAASILTSSKIDDSGDSKAAIKVYEPCAAAARFAPEKAVQISAAALAENKATILRKV